MALLAFLLMPALRTDSKEEVPAPSTATTAPPAAPTAEPSASLEEVTTQETSQKETLYADYVNHLKRLIAPAWKQNLDGLSRQVPFPLPRYVTTVSILVGADGTLISLSVTHASGEAALDDAVVRAWRSRAPFPPPPAGLLADDGVGHFDALTFEVQVGEQGGR